MLYRTGFYKALFFFIFFFVMLRKDTLPHTCIHLKGYFLFAVLSRCVCIPKHEEMTKQSAKVTPQDRHNHWHRGGGACV